jgi:ornithine cyclodeaminase/alanine dehydrogenase-like protein (mu-crystallin family)
MSHAAFIARLGGYQAVAAACAVHPARANHWVRLGIPPRHWVAVQRLAQQLEQADITVQALADHAPQPSGGALQTPQHDSATGADLPPAIEAA